MKRVLPRVEVRPDLTSPGTLDRLKRLEPDLIVSWFWTTKIPMELVNAGRWGGFGVHPSVLPKLRGPDPYFHAIDQGFERTGVSAHVLAEEYDTGAVYGINSIRIDPEWNAWQLARALDRPSLSLLREITTTFARTAPIDNMIGPIPQHDEDATYAPSPADEELELDWTWTTERILRRIRAAAPDPGAWTFFGDEAVTITRAIPAGEDEYPRALAPGEAWAPPIDDTGIRNAHGHREPTDTAYVRTGDGAIALIEGRMDSADDEAPHELDASDLADMVRELRG